MIKELFPAYTSVISKAISRADTKDEQIVCNNLIDHLENDYLYLGHTVPGYFEKLQALRDQLQEKHNELTRQLQEQCEPYTS